MQKLITNLDGNNNRIAILLFCLIQVIFLIQTHAQTISVQGRITTTSKYSVRNASVTFIDNADTTNKFSTLTNISGNYQIEVLTSVKSNTNKLPTKFELAQNYPNPFSSTTDISYGLKKESDIQVIIYDILGRVVRRFDVGRQSVGIHNILWNGRNDFG